MQPVEARRRQHLQEQFSSLQATIASTATYLHRPWEDLDPLALASELSPSPRPLSTRRDHRGESPLGSNPEGEDDELGGWIDGDQSIVGGDMDDELNTSAAATVTAPLSLQLAGHVEEMTKRVRARTHIEHDS